MKIEAKDISTIKPSQILAVFCTFSQSGKSTKVKVHGCDKSIDKILQQAHSDGEFSANANEILFFRNQSINNCKHLVLVGLGDDKKIDRQVLRNASGTLYQSIKAKKIHSAVIHLDSASVSDKTLSNSVTAITQGMLMSEYDFVEFKSDYKPYQLKLEIGVAKAGTIKAVKKTIEEATIVAESINFARHLGDLPGNILYPDTLAKAAVKAVKDIKNLKVTVWDRARIIKERMGGLNGVSLGSGKEPRFIILEYKGAPANKKPICFVGKGLTFDSGGISIKPSAAMDEMKYDMCGGANVIGTLLAIAKLKLKINAIGLVPASENMPGQDATKPGDIFKARNGKTIEVLNTDAEGRLILADALSYATEKKPAVIYDIATLTGAIVMALGNTHTGFFTRSNKLNDKVVEAAEAADELVWRMPLTDYHLADMKGAHADLSNISSFKGAGSSTAAAFLEQFVGEDIPWVHFDIAGTGWNQANRFSYVQKKGATGAMIRTFIELAKKG